MGDNSNSDPRTGSSTPASSSAPTPKRGTTPKPKNNGPPKKPVRILMLHGYTQSGPLFRAKTRALEKLLAKILAPVGLVPEMVYPTAPNRLSPRDVPGFLSRPRGAQQGENDGEEGGEGGADGEEEEEEEIDSWAWFRKDEATGRYRFVREGMETVAREMRGVWEKAAAGEEGDEVEAGKDAGREDGFVDGVIGFSQGGCMAAMLASAMEKDPKPREVDGDGKEHEGWVRAVREANGGRPLRFAVIYSGFYAAPEDLKWLYEPKIRTPTLHFLGSLDTVVEESRSRGLVDRCEEPVVVVHPGGHYVPVSKEWAMPLAGFIRKCMETSE